MNGTLQRLVIQADRTASCAIAGLTQLERVLIEIERWLATRGDTTPPAVVVRWTEPGLRERQPPMTRDHSQVSYLELDPTTDTGWPPGTEDDRAVLTLATSVVWTPGGIAAQLTSRERGEEPEVVPLGVISAPDDVHRLERMLFRALGKPSDGYVTRWVHRRVSTSVTRHLARTRVTPNHISWFVFGLFAAASATVVRGTFTAFVLATIIFKLGDILDGCDGELSRVKYLDSRFGAWLDTTIDMCGNMAFLIAIGIGLSRGSWPSGPGRAYHLYEAVATLVVQVAVIVAFARYTRRTSGEAHFASFGISLAGTTTASNCKQRVILAVAGLLRRDFYTWVFVLLALAGRPDWILHGAAAIAVVHIPILMYAWWRMRSFLSGARSSATEF
jgi:phosphatidylglycerophosphate synthase